MEQTPSLPGRSPELPSVSPTSSKERMGDLSTPEVASGGVIERQEQRSEGAPRVQQAAAPPAALPAPVVEVSSDDNVAAPSQVANDDLPTVAGDDELIEKEWLDKAKKVIAETKDDPYRREQEVSRLQADYLLKRYGRELGAL